MSVPHQLVRGFRRSGRRARSKQRVTDVRWTALQEHLSDAREAFFSLLRRRICRMTARAATGWRSRRAVRPSSLNAELARVMTGA